MQRVVDNAVGVSKEFCKTLCRESFHYGINAVNGASAVLLTFIPRRDRIMEGLQGWEIRPTFRAPRIPQWMEEGVSSLNSLLYDFADFETHSDSDSDDEEGEEGGEDDRISNRSHQSVPPSPSSSSSLTHSHSRNERRRGMTWSIRFRKMLQFIIYPLIFILRFIRLIPNRRSRSVNGGYDSNSSSNSNHRFGNSSLSRSGPSLTQQISRAGSEISKKFTDAVEFVTHMNDNRRRGIIEDLQVITEMAIDRAFEIVRNVLYYALSPWNILTALFTNLGLRFGFSFGSGSDGVVQTTRLSSVTEPPTEHSMNQRTTMNSDVRTCKDLIMDSGYPYESMKLETDDGYILKLERIPRKESKKVVLLQHGLLDTSLGWVSNGVVGSQAFASYDQGYDVFLGNFRGYASREHTDKSINAQKYWNYSINEHGVYDLKAMIEKIHTLKCIELNSHSSPSSPPLPPPPSTATNEERKNKGKEKKSKGEGAGEGEGEGLPYSLSLVSHSMGGAASLMYVVIQRRRMQPHYLSRLILLSPAGFHTKTPGLFDILQWVVPVIDPFMVRYMPAFYIPTRGLRLLFNKLTQDFQNLPAVRALVQVAFSNLVVGGDSSDWVGALRQPHFNMYDMPGLSYRVMKHMAQMKRARAFIMYDYGSAEANQQVYGTHEPFNVGRHYSLIDVPVDVVVGTKDCLIPPSMVMQHYHTLAEAGCKVSVKEFEYAHLDFTFAHKEELLAYVMRRLSLTSDRVRGRKHVEGEEGCNGEDAIECNGRNGNGSSGNGCCLSEKSVSLGSVSNQSCGLVRRSIGSRSDVRRSEGLGFLSKSCSEITAV